MGLKSGKILGISVTTSPKKEILEEIEKYLEKSSEKQAKPFVIATPNPEQIVSAQEDTHFAQMLNRADVALPDGIGLAIALKRPRIPGVEFMEELVRLAATKGYRVGLIGGRGGVAVQALECLRARYPGLTGWAQEPGDVDLGTLGDLDDLREKIQKSNTRLVFVGLGAPKQELFIKKLAWGTGYGVQGKQGALSSYRIPHTAYPIILMSVGGSFDMIAGRVKRAPAVLRGLGLEWLWRLVREPWRIRRQLALMKFLWLLASKG